MVNWDEESNALIEKYGNKSIHTFFDELPDDLKRYKCQTCHHVVWEFPCPCCGSEALKKMCPIDHCHCPHQIIETIGYCPICGDQMCPECGSHDVVQISRVTGYLQEVSGFNAGKKQEVKDRHRWNLGDR